MHSFLYIEENGRGLISLRQCMYELETNVVINLTTHP